MPHNPVHSSFCISHQIVIPYHDGIGSLLRTHLSNHWTKNSLFQSENTSKDGSCPGNLCHDLMQSSGFLS